MTDDEMWALISFMSRPEQKMASKIMHVRAQLIQTNQPRIERTMTTPDMMSVDGVTVVVELSRSTIHRRRFKWLWDPRYDPPEDLLGLGAVRTKPISGNSYFVILAERDALKKENQALRAQHAEAARVIKHLAKKNE